MEKSPEKMLGEVNRLCYSLARKIEKYYDDPFNEKLVKECREMEQKLTLFLREFEQWNASNPI